MPRIKSHSDLLALCIITLALYPVIAFVPLIAPRLVLSIPLTFFSTGYALLCVLYPRKSDMKGMERVLLSFGLSLAILPIICFILNYTSSLALYPTFITLTLFVVVMSIVAWLRRRHIPEEENPVLVLCNISLKDIPGVVRSFRFILWILLIALTLAILLFPVHFTLDPYPIQSVNIFSNLPLFAVLFIIWMALLLILLFSKRRGEWEKLALVSIFAFVFLDFWNIISPYGYHADTMGHLGMVRHLQDAAKLPELRIGYWGFPGLHLFANFLAQATDLNLFETAYIIRITEQILFAALLYLFCTNSLKSSYLAPIAVMLVLMATSPLYFAFIPHPFALVLLAAYLVILSRNERQPFGTSSDILIAIILLVATTMTSFWHSMLFFFIPLGLYLTQIWSKEKAIGITAIILPLVFLLSWEMYYSISTFGSLTKLLPSVRQNIITGDIFATTAMSAEAAWGPEVPLWAVVTNYFWLVTIIGLGTVVGFVQLARAKKLDSLDKRMLGGLLGVILFFIVVTVVSVKGYYATRYQEFARLFTPVILIGFWHDLPQPFGKVRLSLSQHWQKGSIIVVVILLFVMSLPTFLYVGRSIGGEALTSQDITAGEFLADRYGRGDGLIIFGNESRYASGICSYYIPQAERNGSIIEEYKLGKESVLWEEMRNTIADFKNSTANSIFIYSEKKALGYLSWFGIRPEDPRWQDIKKQLADFVGEENVWSNEYYSIYIHP